VSLPSPLQRHRTLQTREHKIDNRISFQAGQFAVVGKTNLTPTDGAMILVLTGRAVD
jgi:hypothetical protein